MRLVWRVFQAVLALLAVSLGLALGSYWYFSRDLPSVEELKAWRPPQVTKVTCRNGAVCAEFYTERRTWVDLSSLPPHVRDAFLAAEDADFYQHQGLDYLGILRSALKNLRPYGQRSGASTISQQLCRWLLLSQERTLARKIREWILTPRMEAALGKDQVLNLYVNTIYFGHRRHGVEEAALFYFGKSARQLSVGEAAVLAGTVQSPNLINPLTNLVRAKKRQRYVLGQLADKGFVPADVVRAELDRPIVLGPRPQPLVGQYYAEEVRRQLVARHGEAAVMRGGLRVQVAMEPQLQAAAEAAVKAGLEALDMRQGYRGPLGAVEPPRFAALKELLLRRLTEAGKRRPEDVLVADLAALQGLDADEEGDRPPALEDDERADPDEPIPSEDEKLVRAVAVKPLALGLTLVGWVAEVDDARGVAVIDAVGRQAELRFESVKWARRRGASGLGPPPTRLSQVVSPGELVRVRLGKAVPASTRVEATLAQVPAVQGALVAIAPQDRSVVAMVGGYDFGTSAFNRATQALRQPGSSFKPFLYAAALEGRAFTPLTKVNDAPEAIRDPFTGKTWKPQNYERSGADGPVTLREALTRSKNTVSVRVMEAVTPRTAIAFARRAGIVSPLPENLTLALGTGEVTVLEAANAYATLQALGQHAEPVIIAEARDASGRLLEAHAAAPEQVIEPAVAYLATSLMRSVVEEGTATQVLELARPAAGKTGTASEYKDAWFSGYTAELVASAWVGFDEPRPLGPSETGGRAALPIWLAFMKAAHQGKPPVDFPVPAGVVQVRVDPATGLLAGRAVPGRLESFLAGTEPQEETAGPGQVDANEFELHDGRR